MTEAPILSVEGLRAWLTTPGRTVKAVDGVDLAIFRRETVAVVGESGSGKSVLGLSIMGLVARPAGRVVGGRIMFAGQGGMRDLASLHGRAMRRIRRREIAMIFQDPMTSLDPLCSIGAQIAETLRQHEGLGRAARGGAPVGIGGNSRRRPPRRRIPAPDVGRACASG